MKKYLSISFFLSVIITFIVAIISYYLAKIQYFNILGQLVIALLIGMFLQLLFRGNIAIIKEGNGLLSNKFLRGGIILLGFRLSIDKLITNGKITLVSALFVVVFMLFLSYALCRFFNVEKDLALLASCGCSICGAAAVMGVSSQIKAKTDDSVLAVAVVAILGTLFTVLEVTLRPYLGLGDEAYGIMAGASLHEIAHAVAAGGAAGNAGLEAAILMKLSRVLMLVIVILGIAIFSKNSNKEAKKPFPYFIFGFIATSIVGSYIPLVQQYIGSLVTLAYMLLAMAMTALGMSVNFNALRERGGRVLLACMIASTILFVLCYVAISYLY